MIKKLLFLTILFGSVTNLKAQSYCTPAINFNCTDDDLITNFVFSNISNATQCGNTTTGYTYYSNLTAIATKGSQYQASVTVGNGWTYESVAVAIDYDQN